MGGELSDVQRRNRAKLRPPAPKSERREYAVATVRATNKPRRTHEPEKVIIRAEGGDLATHDEDSRAFREVELRSSDVSRKGSALEHEVTQKIEGGVLTERDFERIREQLADVRNELLGIQSDAHHLPEGRRRTALMRANYDVITSIENAIHQGDLDIDRREAEKRRKAISERWSFQGH